MATLFTVEDVVDIVYSTHACTDGDTYIYWVYKRMTKLSFARHLSVLYNKNSNYGKLIML